MSIVHFVNCSLIWERRSTDGGRWAREDGFTLIELIVVLGVLAGIAVPRITGVRGDADDAAVKSNLSSMQSALEMHHTMDENREYPKSDTELENSSYIGPDLVSLFGDNGDDNYAYFSDEGNDYIIVYDFDGNPTKIEYDSDGKLTSGEDNDFYITSEGGSSW
ncbi:type II secretion system GspH family protein [Natroniella acetigena]|uniref:type II secretion system protein n=1 Tax=Natroniella acetigena TaxID=52004 RepID=UPI00200AF3C9|nr:prepilin-type N-terminal cleavage/methylation domain-containing protein [Natroniella acetigena]MCK8827968.1 type II secretion system GspH family protein [Natroniella acetigena]